MPGLGAPELIVILVIALVVLGPKRLPEAGRGLGRSLREFKDGLTGPDEERPAIDRDGAGPA
jgi:sec-independent protein translocase protein TatA